MNDYDTSYRDIDHHEALPNQVCPECGEQLFLFIEHTISEATTILFYCRECGYED